MTNYKGYYIDHIYFCSKADIDEHIKAQAVKRYTTLILLQDAHSDDAEYMWAAQAQICEQAGRLHELGCSWDEIEQIEINAIVQKYGKAV